MEAFLTGPTSWLPISIYGVTGELGVAGLCIGHLDGNEAIRKSCG
jgi:hypothetical protein